MSNAPTVTTPANGQAIEVGSHRSLIPSHLAELAASGISPEFAKRAQLYTESNSHRIARLLNRKSFSTKHGHVLAFPYFDPEGHLVQTRCKPLRPERDTKGRDKKYLQPSRTKSHAYYPPNFNDFIGAKVNEVHLVEGEKKCLCLAERKRCTIGLAGVWNWKPGGKASSLLPELEQFKWQDCCVFIHFDSDAWENPNIMLAMQLLATTLRSRGGNVRATKIPAGPDGKKHGIDDFIVAAEDNWRLELDRLLKEAVDVEEVDPGMGKESAADLDPASEAESIVLAMTKDGVPRMRFWDGQFWLHRGGRFIPQRDDEVRCELINNLNEKYIGVRPRHASDVTEHLKAKTILPSRVRAPAWLTGNGTEPDALECVALKNGILHLPAIAKVGNPLLPPTPRFLATAACDFNYEPDPETPKCWLDFLDSIWGDDSESIEALQEWFGYTLTGDTSQQKILLLIGPTRSGKGVIGRIQRRVIGESNVCGPTLGSLATTFGLQPLLGKSLALISDARLNGRADQSVVLERLLSISGEDAISVDMKFKDPVTAKLPTRLMILSNELPKLLDASSAITGRFIVLRMNHSFLGREDRGLLDRIAKELSGIFRWACEGWLRLKQRGGFKQPSSALELLGELRDLASPVTAFVHERCEIGPGQCVTVAELFGEWSSWCRSQGRDHTGTAQMFGRDLLAAASGVMTKQRREQGKVVRYYEGIAVARNQDAY